MEKKLFPCGEYKFIPAIHALENLIDELHTRVPQPPCRATAAAAQSLYSPA
jgi:hypothetical protein